MKSYKINLKYCLAIGGCIAGILLGIVSPALADEKDQEIQGPSKPLANIYDLPYKFEVFDNTVAVDGKMLGRNTATMVGAGFGVLAFLYVMPSSFTNWEDDGESPFSKWWDNVSQAPVWDKDDIFLNYVTHPYAGAVYYMGARSAGVNPFYSFLYSAAFSTFFWEYGVEAFAERPSIQDLIVTPVAGAILGEGFYLAKRHILENDNELWGSRALGVSALFLMDPFTEVSALIWDDDDPKKSKFSMHSYPSVTASGNVGYHLMFSYAF